MADFQLTVTAEGQLQEIYFYTLERFGREQAVRYLEALYRVFGLLAETPGVGRRAQVLGDGVRRHEHASHGIFYELSETGILVLAVVHERSIRKIVF